MSGSWTDFGPMCKVCLQVPSSQAVENPHVLGHILITISRVLRFLSLTSLFHELRICHCCR